MGETITIGADIDKESNLYDEYSDWMNEQGLKNKSEATRILLRRGLENKQNPVRRFLENIAASLAIIAIVVFVAGYISTIFTPAKASIMSWFLLAFAGGLFAMSVLFERTPGKTIREKIGNIV